MEGDKENTEVRAGTDYDRIGREALKKWSSSRYAKLGRKHVAGPSSLLNPTTWYFYHRAKNENFQTLEQDATDYIVKGTENFHFNLLDYATSIYSRRAYRYPVFEAKLSLPKVADLKVNDLYLGLEAQKGTEPGIASFRFLDDSTVKAIAGGYPKSGGARTNDVTDRLYYSPWNGTYRYYIKVNRASVEFWQDFRLVGIVQFGLGQSGWGNSPNYLVRDADPYYLKQMFGSLDAPMSALVEMATDNVGDTTELALGGIYAAEGDPAPPRQLEPWTGGSNWAGTSISSGTLTSDRIPCAGYDDVTVFFKADTAGTLDLNVDYGFDALDEYDSVSVPANSLKKYKPAEEKPWLQLEYTPDSYPATVTRANVVMK